MGVSYKIEHEGDGFYTIKHVPIFEFHNNRGFECDEAWMRETIQNFEQGKATGYRPSIIIGHNVKGVEKESYGFLDNFILKGKQLYADLVRVPKSLKEKIIQNAYPNRSVEVLPQSKRILALALLGGTAPYFSLPQMVYNNDEESLWYRSPIMLPNSSFNSSSSPDVAQIAATAAREAVAQYAAQQAQTNAGAQPQVYSLSVPEAVEFFQSNPEAEVLQSEGGEFYCQIDQNVYYQIPQQVAQYGIKDAIKSGFSGGVATGNKARHHRGKIGLATGGVVGGLAGLAMGARSGPEDPNPVGTARRVSGYQIDENTGIVYCGGRAIGEVSVYDGNGDGVSELPPEDTGQAHLSIDDSATGEGSGDEDALSSDVGSRANPFLTPLDEEDSSEQFSDPAAAQSINYIAEENNMQNAELYQLRQQVDRLTNANELLNVSRKAENYKSYLLDQKKSGAPVGDIPVTVDYLLSQTDEQVKQFKRVLETSPKLKLGATEYALPTHDDNETKKEFSNNRLEYGRLGVTAQDLEYANYVRVNDFGTNKNSGSNNGRAGSM